MFKGVSSKSNKSLCAGFFVHAIVQKKYTWNYQSNALFTSGLFQTDIKLFPTPYDFFVALVYVILVSRQHNIFLYILQNRLPSAKFNNGFSFDVIPTVYFYHLG